jgi:hypothetical protein
MPKAETARAHAPRPVLPRQEGCDMARYALDKHEKLKKGRSVRLEIRRLSYITSGVIQFPAQPIGAFGLRSPSRCGSRTSPEKMT